MINFVPVDLTVRYIICYNIRDRSVSLKLYIKINLQFNNWHFASVIFLYHSGRHRKIIIHVPVKLKKEKHTHTLIKPLHVHHKQTIIKEEVKPIIKEIHKPIEIHKYHHKPVEIHKEYHHKPVEVHKEYHHKHVEEIHHKPEIKIEKPKPIYKEEISHEHLHHHYKHVHPDISSDSSTDFGSESHGSSYSFQNSHP